MLFRGLADGIEREEDEYSRWWRRKKIQLQTSASTYVSNKCGCFYPRMERIRLRIIAGEKVGGVVRVSLLAYKYMYLNSEYIIMSKATIRL